MNESVENSIEYFSLAGQTLHQWYVEFMAYSPKLLVGILVFCFFFFASKFLSQWLIKILEKFFSIKIEILSTLIGVFRFLVVLVGAFVSLEILGLSNLLWKFIGSLGVAGVIAGVALKDLASSIFSGMLINIDKAFKVGDYISIGGNSGTVSEIGLLSTKIFNDEGKKIYIPNQLIFNSPFVNLSASEEKKVIINLEIPACEDMSKVQKVLLSALGQIQSNGDLENSSVHFLSIKQGVFNLQVSFPLKEKYSPILAKSEALLKIKEHLDQAQIQIKMPLTFEN